MFPEPIQKRSWLAQNLYRRAAGRTHYLVVAVIRRHAHGFAPGGGH